MRSRSAGTLFGATLVWLCAAGTQARAQSTAPRAGCTRMDAEIALSVRERVAGRTTAALAVLEDLHGRCPVPQVTAQLALAEIDAQQLQRAWAHLNGVLADIDDPWARSRRAALIVARTELRARMGSLLVRGAPSGAEVLVDGQRIGALPFGEAYVLAPGTYGVEVRAAGHATATRSITLQAGQDLDIPLSAAPLTVASTDSSPSPARVPPLAAAPSRGARIVGYTLLGLGAASLAVSTVMIFRSATQADALRDATSTSDGPEGAFVRFVSQPGYTATDRSTDTACTRAASDNSPDGRSANELCQDNARARLLAWTLGAAGAVAAGVGTTLILLGGRGTSGTATLRVSPVVVGATGMMVHGTF